MSHTVATVSAAIRFCADRGCTVEMWAERAVDECLRMSHAAPEGSDERALFHALDQLAYAMRWATMTGRYTGVLYRAPLRANLPVMVRIVRDLLASRNVCVDTAYRLYRVA